MMSDSPSETNPFARACILTGPTGAGKSELALEVAEELGGEILAVDSMTVYRGMNIGTAKPSAADQAGIPHHLIDLLEPYESATVAWWLAEAHRVCAEIVARGKRPIFVGGTPFYLKALLYGLFPAPPGDLVVRSQLEAEAATAGPLALHAKLAAIDPISAKRLHPNDVRRVARALEVYTVSGRPISEHQTTWDSPSFAHNGPAAPVLIPLPCVVLQWPTEVLNQRINRRVEAMFAAGWREECQRLVLLPKPLSREAGAALGYREILNSLAGTGRAWAELVPEIQLRSRQFAKRQRTWFRHLPNTLIVDAAAPDRLLPIISAWR